MGTEIHPSSVVDPAATIGDGVTIGPFCTVGPEVTLEDGVSLTSHVAVAGRTRIGSGTRVYPFASLGHPPQDLKFKGEVSELTIGRDVTIREGVTANPGTEGGGMKTVVGDKCLLMAYSHVAHDCRVGNSVILANSATLGGHVTVGDHAILGGLSAVQQWVRIGEHAFIGGMTGVEQDVIPFGMVVGERGHLAGLNLVGLKRRGFDRSDIHTLRAAYRLLFQEPGELSQRIDVLSEAYGEHPAVTHLLAFLRADSGRKILQPKFEDAA